MQGNIKKLKDNNGLGVYPVTRGEAVFVEDNKTLNQKLSELEASSVSSSGVAESGLKAKPPMVHFVFDDMEMFHWNNKQFWLDRNIRYTIALRQDFVGGALTWDIVRQFADLGFEIAYHGTKHNFNSAELAADIDSYMYVMDAQGLPRPRGYVGANGLYDERIVNHDYFYQFDWIRSNGSNKIRDYFKNFPGIWIDNLSTQTRLDELKLEIDALATRGTGVLTYSAHIQLISGGLTYLEQFVDYILSKGIKIVTTGEAWKTYGAVMEYYSDSINLNTELTTRKDGNGSVHDISKPHFVLMADGAVISNSAPVRLIQPTKNGVAMTDATKPSEYPLGISIMQLGTDNAAGTLGGTVYTFNLGRNEGSEQFQIIKQTNGIKFREYSATASAWSSYYNMGLFKPKPTATNSAGQTGDFSADSSYLYICYAPNAWIRVPKDGTWTTTI